VVVQSFLYKIETFARRGYNPDYNILTKKFKNQDSRKLLTIKTEPFLRGVRLITSPILPSNDAFYQDFGVRVHLSNYTGRISRILAPFF
jgi:hypothetical protein